jgi:hypothetical protein
MELSLRPSAAVLENGGQTLAWGEAVRTWRGRYRYRCVLSPTPTGAIKLSPMDLNLTDVAAVESRIRSLAGPNRDLQFAGPVWLSDAPRPIVLLLSDLSVRATVLELEQLPAQAEEQEALIRWRQGRVVVPRPGCLAGFCHGTGRAFPAVLRGDSNPILGCTSPRESGLLPQELLDQLSSV